MPAIPDYVLECSFYLYAQEADATEGTVTGACGFLVGIQNVVEGWWSIYAVTNWHVVSNGLHWLRLNTKGGGVHIERTQPDDWLHHPSADIAVLDLTNRDFDRCQARLITLDMFVEQQPTNRWLRLEVGDEAVLIGRLISHSGRVRNKPVARFGNIAMLPDETEMIRVGDTEEVAFLVDCRSLSGSSGSAVLGFRLQQRFGMFIEAASKPQLLGIDCGHLPFWSGVRDANGELVTPRCKVESNSGIAVVVPAWKIREVLEDPRLAQARAAENERLRRQFGDQPNNS